MSNKKNKIAQNFRIDFDVLETVKEMVKQDPVTFASQARIVDAALFHFVHLSKTQQKEILKKYLTKDL